MLHQSNGTIIELGKASHIKTAEESSLDELSRSITLTFNENGEKLYFIDERVTYALVTMLTHPL